LAINLIIVQLAIENSVWFRRKKLQCG